MDVTFQVLKTILLFVVPLAFMSFAYYQIVRVLWSTESIPGGRRETSVHHHTNGNGVAHHVENGNGHCGTQRKRKSIAQQHSIVK